METADRKAGGTGCGKPPGIEGPQHGAMQPADRHDLHQEERAVKCSFFGTGRIFIRSFHCRTCLFQQHGLPASLRGGRRNELKADHNKAPQQGGPGCACSLHRPCDTDANIGGGGGLLSFLTHSCIFHVGDATNGTRCSARHARIRPATFACTEPVHSAHHDRRRPTPAHQPVR